MDEMVSIPSARPMISWPPRMTSPVGQSMPPKVISTSPSACIMRARSMGRTTRRRTPLAFQRQLGRTSIASSSARSTSSTPSRLTPCSAAFFSIASTLPTTTHEARPWSVSSATALIMVGFSPSKKATRWTFALARSRMSSIRFMYLSKGKRRGRPQKEPPRGLLGRTREWARRPTPRPPRQRGQRARRRSSCS